jgi:hypothetical protein
MNTRTRLTETDLQLYLAGALPTGKRLMMAWALLMDGALRADLERLKDRNESFRRKEGRRLQGILFPDVLGSAAAQAARRSEGASPSRIAEASGIGNDTPAAKPVFGFRGGWAPALAGALSLAVLCVLPFRGTPDGTSGLGTGIGDLSGFDGSPSAVHDDFVAKGGALGVNLFVKGDTAYRVEHQAARVAATDTLQVVPLGSEAQHLVLLGWDARQGLVRLFPREGERARKVSGREPPPALLLQDMADNRLICVTAVGSFRIAEAEAALRRAPFLPMEKAPASHLHKGLYLQVFSIAKEPARL